MKTDGKDAYPVHTIPKDKWVTLGNINKESKKGKTMNYTTAVFLINPEGVKACKVSYEKDYAENKKATTYLYKTFILDLKVGDYVVVPTTTRHGMTVCKVVEIDSEVDVESSIELNWIVARVDAEPYQKASSWEASATAKIKTAQAHKKREEWRKSLEDAINGTMDEIKALSFVSE